RAHGLHHLRELHPQWPGSEHRDGRPDRGRKVRGRARRALEHLDRRLPHATTAADVAAGAEDHNIDVWNELRDSVPEEYLPLFVALKGLGLPPPSDALGELVWEKRVSDAVAWIYWETPAGNVGLIPPGALADNLDGIAA